MNDYIIYLFLPVIGSFFILYFIFYCMEQIGTEVTIKKYKKQLIIWTYICISVGISFLQNGLLNLLFLLIVPILGYLLYNRRRNYILYYLSFIIALYLTDLLAVVGINLLYQEQILYFTNEKSYTVVLILGTRFMEYAVLRLLTSLIQRNRHDRITKKQLLLSLMLPVFSLFNMLSMMLFLDVFPSLEHQLLFSLNIVLLILLNLYFTNIIDTMSRNNHLENELNLYQQQQVIQTRYYENLEHKYESTRSLVHDIRNHIQALEHLYETEAAPISREYVRDIHGMLNQLGQRYYTSNKMLNIILNDKVQQMNEHGIREDIKIAEVNLDFLRNIDITTLFSNLLDNAIEAAAASTQKNISLRITTTHDFISITLRNSSDQSPLQEGTSFRSIKENHEGLGLRNIERVVEQYKGDIQYEWKDSYFTTRIMLTG